MTDKKTEALKPCEYCGHPLPQSVDKRTRQIRSHHFDSCKVRLEQKALEEQRPQNCGTGFCSCIECPYVQPAQQEPVAWMYDTTLPDGEVITDWTSIAHPSIVTLPDEGVHNIRPLYAAPQPSKPWVGLTDENYKRMWSDVYNDTSDSPSFLVFARAIEAKLKEKNT